MSAAAQRKAAQSCEAARSCKRSDMSEAKRSNETSNEASIQRPPDVRGAESINISTLLIECFEPRPEAARSCKRSELSEPKRSVPHARRLECKPGFRSSLIQGGTKLSLQLLVSKSVSLPSMRPCRMLAPPARNAEAMEEENRAAS